MSSVVSRPPPAASPSMLMLPYGYQIDLDFIKYCENLTHPNPSDAELQRRQRRRQRQSMEVMLGIQMEMQNQMDELHDFWERKPPEPPPRTHHHRHSESPIVPFYMKQQKRQPNMPNWDPSLNDVVDDFEKTLERSNSKREKGRRSLPAPNAKGYSNFEIGEFETFVNIFQALITFTTLQTSVKQSDIYRALLLTHGKPKIASSVDELETQKSSKGKTKLFDLKTNLE